jgi:hypothetical protein
VIDTSPQYNDGDAELMIGTVLDGMIQEKLIQRENVILMTKVGQVPINIDLKYKHVKDRFYATCIEPEFINEQLQDSLERLNADTIDVYTLENLERVRDLFQTEDEYFDYLKQTFIHMETLVADGKIQKYGIASEASFDPRVLSLEKILSIAKQVNPNHNLQVVQFPFNIQEPNAYMNKIYSNKSLIEYAKENQLTTISYRPLDAIVHGKQYRFSDIEVDNNTHTFNPSQQTDEQTALKKFLKTLETTVQHELAFPMNEELSERPTEELPHRTALSWAQILGAKMNELDTLQVWESVLENRIRPELRWALEKLRKHSKLNEWITQYNFVRIIEKNNTLVDHEFIS